MPNFWICEHVHVCIAEDIIWLDRRNGKYHKTSGSNNEMLGRLVHGWPRVEQKTGQAEEWITPTVEAQHALATKLVAKGLISATISNGHRYRNSVVTPASTAIQQAASEDTTVRPRDCQRLVRAYLTTRLLLKCGHLHLALSRIERKKEEWSEETSADADTLRRLIAAFRYLRILLYTSKERCLFDSLVLMRFLLAYGIAPSLVIGVTARPFHAHCWLQLEETILIGEVDFIRRFSPILVI